MSNALSRESTLDCTIELLNALNRSTRARGTIRLHLPSGACEQAPASGPGNVWQRLSYDYATYHEALHAANAIQSVYSAYAESKDHAEHLEAELYGPALIIWVAASDANALGAFIRALARRLDAFG
jgi:hypothetical protein